MTLSVYGWTVGVGGTAHYRIREPLRALALSGFNTEHGMEMHAGIQREHDIIVAHMPHTEMALGVWRALKNGGHNKLVFDIDDYAWNYPKGSGTREYWTVENLGGLEECARLADLVTTPSFALAEVMRGFNKNVVLIPNTVPITLTNQRERQQHKVFRVGYQGASQHKMDFAQPGIQESLGMFLSSHPYAELHLYGFHKGSVYFPKSMASRVKIREWQPDLAAYYKSLDFEVGIGPLSDHPFNEYKSDIRIREYMAIGAIPVVQTNGVYAERIDDKYSFLRPHELYTSLHKAYQLWHQPEEWNRLRFERRHIARTFFTTETNAGRIADEYRRLGYGAY